MTEFTAATEHVCRKPHHRHRQGLALMNQKGENSQKCTLGWAGLSS